MDYGGSSLGITCTGVGEMCVAYSSMDVPAETYCAYFGAVTESPMGNVDMAEECSECGSSDPVSATELANADKHERSCTLELDYLGAVAGVGLERVWSDVAMFEASVWTFSSASLCMSNCIADTGVRSGGASWCEDSDAAGMPDSTGNVVSSAKMGEVRVSGTDYSPDSNSDESWPTLSDLLTLTGLHVTRKKHWSCSCVREEPSCCSCVRRE